MFTSKQNVSLSALAKVPLKKPPNAGKYWTGVKHSKLVDAFLAGVNSKGWHSKFLNADLSRDGGDMDFVVGLDTQWNSGDVTLCLGVATSNHRRRAFTVYGGARAGDGTNLTAFRLPTRDKHSKEFDPLKKMDEILMSWYRRAISVPDLILSLQKRTLVTEEVPYLMSSFGIGTVRGGMGWYAVGKVTDHYFKECKEPTAWSLLTAFDRQCKKLPALRQMPEGLRFLQGLPTAWAAAQPV